MRRADKSGSPARVIELVPSARWERMLDPNRPTPYAIVDLSEVEDRYRRLVRAIPGVKVHYAVKCNPDVHILRKLADLGSSFEVASAAEVGLLDRIGVDARSVIFSNPIKTVGDIESTFARGVTRFAAQSEAELHKLAEHAPGSSVYVRFAVDDHSATFPLSRKFGASSGEVAGLLTLAVDLGLRPYGLTFHVGSQQTDPIAWSAAIDQAGEIMRQLHDTGINIEVLNIGGGFPSTRAVPVPSVERIGAEISAALGRLPYGVGLLAEPGRFLVADALVMVASVVARERRQQSNWLYLDIGAFNGLVEAIESADGLDYPAFVARRLSDRTEEFAIGGPSCDQGDVLYPSIRLPHDIAVGDHVVIESAGAYSMSCSTTFNGFAAPQVHYELHPDLHRVRSRSVPERRGVRHWIDPQVRFVRPDDAQFDAALAFEADVMMAAYGFDTAVEYAPYNEASCFYVVEDDAGIVGALREIHTSEAGFKTLHDFDDVLFVEARERLARQQPHEIVEVATASARPGSTTNLDVARLYSSLLRVWIFERRGRYFVASIDDRLLRVLRRRFGLQLEAIGATKFYLGSPTTPVLLDLDRQLDHFALRGRHLFERVIGPRRDAEGDDVIDLREADSATASTPATPAGAAAARRRSRGAGG